MHPILVCITLGQELSDSIVELYLWMENQGQHPHRSFLDGTKYRHFRYNVFPSLILPVVCIILTFGVLSDRLSTTSTTPARAEPKINHTL
jgi:hypothetical protein